VKTYLQAASAHPRQAKTYLRREESEPQCASY